MCVCVLFFFLLALPTFLRPAIFLTQKGPSAPPLDPPLQMDKHKEITGSDVSARSLVSPDTCRRSHTTHRTNFGSVAFPVHLVSLRDYYLGQDSAKCLSSAFKFVYLQL